MKFISIPAGMIFMLPENATVKTDQEVKMNLSNKEKIVKLLTSIETGDPNPVSYINPDKYIQHNLMVGDGLAGFGEVLKQLLEGSAKVRVVRAFQDGDYVFAHTEYEFFEPKIGFDIFRFEKGMIVEHWDNLQAIAIESASGRTQTDGATKAIDLDKTDANKALVDAFVRDVLKDARVSCIWRWIWPLVNPGTSGAFIKNPAVLN